MVNNEDISFIAEAFSENFGVSLQDFNRAYNTITGIADPISMNNKCGLGDWYLPLYTELINCYSDAYDIDLLSYDWRL